MSISSIEAVKDQEIELRDHLSFIECPTQAKVMRAATTAIGITLPLCGIVSNSPSLFALSLAGSAIAFISQSYINDYDDPIELQKMQKEAKAMNWDQLVSKHRLSCLSEVLSQKEIMQKFQEYYEDSYFSDIVSQYSLSTISQYGLAEFSELSFLRDCFIQEIRQNPIKVLRSWIKNNWGLENSPYERILPFSQMEGLLVAKAELNVADTNYENTCNMLSNKFNNQNLFLGTNPFDMGEKVTQETEVQFDFFENSVDISLDISHETNEQKINRNLLAMSNLKSYDLGKRAAQAELEKATLYIKKYVLSIV